MEENNQIDETIQTEKAVTSSVTPQKTTTPVRRTATRKPVVKKEVETSTATITPQRRAPRVKKPIEVKPIEETTATVENSVDVIADESGNEIVEVVTPANHETKKLEKNNIKKLKKMSKKITEKEKKEKAKMKLKAKAAKKKAASKKKKAKAKSKKK